MLSAWTYYIMRVRFLFPARPRRIVLIVRSYRGFLFVPAPVGAFLIAHT